MFHVVLIEPEIPWNTGNVGRTCLAAGAQLHLVGPLGFFLDQAEVKRAGLGLVMGKGSFTGTGPGKNSSKACRRTRRV